MMSRMGTPLIALLDSSEIKFRVQQGGQEVEPELLDPPMAGGCRRTRPAPP
jgi:hypothetical protein